MERFHSYHHLVDERRDGAALIHGIFAEIRSEPVPKKNWPNKLAPLRRRSLLCVPEEEERHRASWRVEPQPWMGGGSPDPRPEQA